MDRKILYFIQLPPPLHGVSLMNQITYLSEVINCGFKKSLVPIKFSNTVGGLRKITLHKLFKSAVLAFRLVKTLITEKPDYVYFSLVPEGYGYLRDMLYVSILKIFPVRIIYHLHLNLPERSKQWFLLQLCYRFTFKNTIVLSPSKKVLSSIASLKVPDVCIHYISNGVPQNLGIEYHAKHRGINLLYLSHIRSEKGIFDLLKAFRSVSQTCINARLDVVGGCYGRKIDKKIRRFIHSNDLQNKVFLHGEKHGEEKQKFLENADIFIFPSHAETFGLALIEAMQAGIAVIATPVGIANEIIRNGKNGILVQAGNVKQLTDKIELLIHSPDSRQTIGSEGRITACSFTVEAYEAGIRKIFDSI